MVSALNYNTIIVGGGIVGLSTAMQLQRRFPEQKVLLLEKEAEFAKHQTGHNSGVIHAGVYYPPGSLKATFCQRGVEATLGFCRQHNIAVEQCGKLLVATHQGEMARMQDLYQRCLENGLEVELLSATQLRAREPNIIGLGAIYAKASAIVDYRQVSFAMAKQFQQLGGECRLDCEVIGLAETAAGITVSANSSGEQQTFNADFLVTCTGLMADRTTRMLGIKTDFQIIPFRGEYYQLAPQHKHIVKHLIYPIPDPALPFLGVHLTPMIDGSVTVGPNAVQGWKREGYGTINLSFVDIVEMLTFRGFWSLLKTHYKTGLVETWCSWWKPGYLKRVQKYCPQLTLNDLKPYPAGVRAQAVLADGSLVDDFLFAHSPRSLHVCNAPSPAATSAIPIGGYIVDKVIDSQPKQQTSTPQLD